VAIADIAEKTGISRHTLNRRFKQNKDLFLEESRPYGIAAAARETGLSESCIRNRMKRNGLTLEEAKRGTKK
jgi:DNA-binding Lrp family transcriptional regulator